MPRMLVCVDGLNIFHALRDLDEDLLRIDLMALSKFIADGHGISEVRVQYFTAKIRHLGNSVKEAQHKYLAELRSSGVEVVLGEFRSQSQNCPHCETKFWKHQEKQTDVALATELVKGALNGEYEEILLFSADSDFLPAVQFVTQECPWITIRIVSTVAYLRPVYATLVRASQGQIRLSAELVSKFQFGSTI